MQLIRSVTKIYPKRPNGKTILYMHGHGGRTWQAKRQLKVLQTAGYSVIALDFNFTITSPDPQHLISLVDEVDNFISQHELLKDGLIIVGISLGGLIGYNMVRRHNQLKRLLVITGGNIALLTSNRSLQKKWLLTRNQLQQTWQNVNIFYPVGSLTNKRVIMLLPIRDKVINPNEVSAEISLHEPYNTIRLVRTKGGHFRTIITQTVIRPRGILFHLHELE